MPPSKATSSKTAPSVTHLDDLIDEYNKYKSSSTHPNPQTLSDLQTTQSNTLSRTMIPPLIADFLKAFDGGNHVDLFILWQAHIPRHDLKLLEHMSLEFYLNLHFAIYPFRDSTLKTFSSPTQAAEACARSMSSFKRYLNSRGRALSETPEFISFYALPLVANPIEHETFKTVFTTEWLADLRLKLQTFLSKHLGKGKPTPRIFTECGGGVDADDSYFSNREGLKTLKAAYLQRERHLVGFSQSLHNVALELLENLKESKGVEANVDVNIVKIEEQMKQFQATLDDFLPVPVPVPAPVKEKFKEKVDKRTVAPSSSSSSFPPLNFDSIKVDLQQTNNDKQVCLILQALCWRLKKQKKILSSYVSKDILTPNLLNNTNPLIVEYFIRLISTIASSPLGRHYLTSQPSVIMATLSKILITMTSESVLRTQVLETLQKCSLKRAPQIDMLKAGVMKWIADVLDKHVSKSEVVNNYSLEYITALLMNLCLRSYGKNIAATCDPGILEVLVKLLEVDNSQVRHYVNGSIYSLLSLPSLRDKALYSLELDLILKKVKARSNEHFGRQVQFIVDMLISSSKEVESDDDDEDEDEVEEASEEGEEEEAEEEKKEGEDQGHEILLNEDNSLQGDALLSLYSYSAEEMEAVEAVEEKVEQMVVERVEERVLTDEDRALSVGVGGGGDVALTDQEREAVRELKELYGGQERGRVEGRRKEKEVEKERQKGKNRDRENRGSYGSINSSVEEDTGAGGGVANKNKMKAKKVEKEVVKKKELAIALPSEEHEAIFKPKEKMLRSPSNSNNDNDSSPRTIISPQEDEEEESKTFE